MQLNPFKFLKPKNVTFCPGCPKKELVLNKNFQLDIPMPTVKEPESVKSKVTTLKDMGKVQKQNSGKIKTLF